MISARGVLSGAVRGTTVNKEGLLDCCYWYERQIVLLHTDRKHPAFRAAYSERVHCANAFRMSSTNSSLARKSCACRPIAFLEVFISWSADNTLPYAPVTHTNCPLASQAFICNISATLR